MRLRRSGQGTSPCFRPRLRPRLAPAVASAPRLGTQTGPPRTDPPLREATPEIEPVDRAAIRDRAVVGGGGGSDNRDREPTRTF